MKFLFDLFPVILFFGIFRWGEKNAQAAQELVTKTLSGVMSGGVTPEQAPIILATAVAIVASFAQIGYLLARRKKVDLMLWVSLAVIVVFGGMTIYFNSETFIKWKPTVLYWCFAFALLLGQVLFRKNLIRALMQGQITLPDQVWGHLCYAWIVFFGLMGIVNLYVAFWGNFSTGSWVNFKLFGGFGLTLIFVVAQSIYLSKHMKSAP
ncbi:MAG: septation protein A [Oxalobacter sp.]|nr:MAG: septation protein A [Oxalobacter sp.]